MKQYATRDIMTLDREGEHYSRHVLAMTQERLHEKCDIAAELAWRDHQIEQLKREVERFKGDAAPALLLTAANKKIERLRNAAKDVLRIWDEWCDKTACQGGKPTWETLRKVLSET